MNEANIVIRFLNKMTDLIVLNILFILCCIPVVTIGASISAMYYVNLTSVRYGDGYIAKRFFAAFKRNFKQSTIYWLIVAAIIAVIYVDYRFWNSVADERMGNIMKVISLVFLFIVLMITQWVFPVIAKMDDKLPRQIKNAALMSVGCMIPHTLIVYGSSCIFFYGIYVNFTVMIFAGLIGFALVSWMQSFFLYKAFSRFIKEDPVGEYDPLYGPEAAQPETGNETGNNKNTIYAPVQTSESVTESGSVIYEPGGKDIHKDGE